VRSIFAQPDAPTTHAQHERVIEQLADRFPAAAAMLADAGVDILAFTSFPQPHWRQIWSNNPQERLNKEIRRRTDVVGIFPDRPSVIRLVGMVLAEQHDVRVQNGGAPRGCLQRRCAHRFGVAFHLSGPSGSDRQAMSLDRSATFGADARVRTA
jgi:transposase-like protein